MKKILLVAALMLVVATTWARPALRGAVRCMQPDGTSVMLELHGDEYYHFSTTVDGYTVLQNAQGTYEYARMQGQQLVSTGVQAHDVAQRSAAEQALLASLDKNLTDAQAISNSKIARAARDKANQAPARAFDQSKFRGLIILIQFSDVKFSRSDIVDIYSRMCSERGYQGYTNEDGSTNYYGSLFNGSVRDYFYSQSNGMFDPEFDVYGPYTTTYKATQCDNNSRTIFQAALKALDSQIDFSKYDGDSNGVVDNVCFVVAGWGSHVQGNNSGLLWPHESKQLMTSPKLDGKSFDLYSCSTEMLGGEGQVLLEGIGTFCHEFGHVLGLMDHYDTDYALSGGESHNPGAWDVMAGGADHNYGRTPVGHNIFERYTLGWANPTVIRETGDYSLDAVNIAGQGFIVKTTKAKEYFMIENRQQTGWDRYLPGHGMLVWRVDSSAAYKWVVNQVNTNPERNYFELLRAANTATGDLASDPFPGTMGITRLTNDTYPSLCTWDKTQNKYQIENIREADEVITFHVSNRDENLWASLVETFEDMPVMSTSPTRGVEGEFANWDFVKAYVKTPGSDYCTGTKAVEMVYPSQFTSVSPIYYNIEEVTFDVSNTSSSSAKINLNYSLDEGATWTKAKNVAGSDAITIPANTRTACYWLVPVNNKQAVQFRVLQNSGNKTVPLYIDNFTVYYSGEQGGPEEGLKGDVNNDDNVDIADVNAVIDMMLGKANKVDAADVTGDGVVDIADVNAIIDLMLGK